MSVGDSPLIALLLFRPWFVKSLMPAGLAIDVLAMADTDDDNEQLPVSYRVDDSKSANPHTIPILPSRKLFTTSRSRIVPERMNRRHDALTVRLLINGLDLLGCGRLDQDAISCHAA